MVALGKTWGSSVVGTEHGGCDGIGTLIGHSGASHSFKCDAVSWAESDDVAKGGLMTPANSADLGLDGCSAVGMGWVVE